MAKSSFITVAIYNAAGQLMVQVRDYVNTDGKAIGGAGQLSLLGKRHDGGPVDVPAMLKAETGLIVSDDDVDFIGAVQDETVKGRTNLVHKVTVPFDTALAQQCNTPQELMDKIVAAQGMGIIPLGKDNLKAASEAGNVTAISMQILREHSAALRPRV